MTPNNPTNPTPQPTLTIRLILLHLVLLITPQALAGAPPLGPDDIVYWIKSGSKDYFVPPGVGTLPSQNLGDQAQRHVPNCQAAHPDKICVVQAWDDPAEYLYDVGDNEMWRMRGVARVVAKVDDCEHLTHEGDRPGDSACGVCAPGYIPTTGAYHPNANSPVSTGYECMRPREPNECKILDKFEVVTEQGAYCVDQCAGVGDDGYCIDEVEKDPDEPQCGPDHPEFKGVAGYGGEAILICGDPQNNCPSDYTWGVVQTGTTTVESCFPNAYNPPQCSGTDVLTKNAFGGFSCLPLTQPGDNPDPGGPDDPNNGDSDGDGQGDITGITGQLQDIKKLLGRGNTQTNNINETLKGIGNQIQDGTKAITDAIGNIPGGGGGGGTGNGDGNGDGEQETPVTWSGDAIDLKIGDGLEQLNAVQDEYENLIASIRAEMASSFGSFTGQGTLQDHTFTVRGVEVNAGLSKWANALSIVGSVIVFAATFVALGIIMGAKD